MIPFNEKRTKVSKVLNISISRFLWHRSLLNCCFLLLNIFKKRSAFFRHSDPVGKFRTAGEETNDVSSVREGKLLKAVREADTV